MGTPYFGAAFEHRCARNRDISAVDRAEPVDLLVLILDQRAPVEAWLSCVSAVRSDVVDHAAELACIHKQFFRHATSDYTRPAKTMFLSDGGSYAELHG